MAAQKRRTQVERRDEAERRLLEAGVILAAKRGFDSLSLGEVGIEAGYSRGLPAHHFSTKKAFQRALVEFISDQYRREAKAPVESPGLKSLLATIRRELAMSMEDPIYLSVMAVVLSQTANTSDFSDSRAKLRKTALESYEYHIREGIKTGEIRKTVNAKSLALVLAVTVCGLLAEALVWKIDLVRAGDELLQMILSGIGE